MICDFIADPGAWKASPRKQQTAAMKGGSLFDCLLTEPDKFDLRYALNPYDSFRSKDAQNWRDEMEATGVSVISADQLETAQGQIAAVYANPIASRLIRESKKQVAFRHKTKHNFWSKGLIDLLPNNPEDGIIDLKSCESRALESRRSLQKYIAQWRIHIQAGNYTEGYSFTSGEERTRFRLIFCGREKPHPVAVVELPFRAIMLGADQYRAGVNRFAECLESNRWPSIWDGEVEVDLPEWTYNEGGEA
jgi:exodeoxyribonuclease VIII